MDRSLLEPRFIETCKEYARKWLMASGFQYDLEFENMFIDMFIENMDKYMSEELHNILFGTGEDKPIGIIKSKAVIEWKHEDDATNPGRPA